MRRAGEQLLAGARAVLAAHPDAAAMRAIPFTPLAEGAGRTALGVALRHLWDEMELVRGGEAGGVGVLADEVACVERALAGLVAGTTRKGGGDGTVEGLGGEVV